MVNQAFSEKTFSEKAISKEVDRTSEFWHNYRRRLAAVREQFTGQEAEYLELIKLVLMSQVELVREALLQLTGIDMKAGAQIFPPPDPGAVIRDQAKWENIERCGRDFLQIGKAVAGAMEVARQNGRDPDLDGYATFFWAMENVPVAGTVFLMLDTEGKEKEANTLLAAGWADAHISLQGQHALRLRSSLLAEGGDARHQLRQELPGAVLEAAQLWRPGQELPLGDRARPGAGKATAGRRKRTLLSRVTRLIERQGASYSPTHARQMHNYQAHAQRQRWQAAATRRAAQGVGSLPIGTGMSLQAWWKGLVKSARLGPHAAQVADYIADNLDCLVAMPSGRLRLRRGTQAEMAIVMGRSPNQIRQETMRMLKKLNKALTDKDALAKK